MVAKWNVRKQRILLAGSPHLEIIGKLESFCQLVLLKASNLFERKEMHLLKFH